MKMDKAFKTGALALVLSMTAGAVLANDMEASDFVEDVSQQNYAEIEAGKIVLAKGQSAEVKSFARKMIEEHTQANAKLGALAEKKDIEMEDEAGLIDDAKAMMLKLREDKNVDAAYVEQQVKAHEDAVKLFEKASTTLDDADLKSYAQATLPTLREHLAAAKKLSGEVQ
jgi:putative membrane protein